MKLFSFLNILLCFTQINSLLSLDLTMKKKDLNFNIIPYSKYINFELLKETQKPPRENKIKSYLKLIRSANIIPTIGLGFAGGYMLDPNFLKIATSKNIIVSILIIVCTMSSSMIMNDLFDMKIDRINNPERPLITGEVSEREAHILNAVILGVVEILNIGFLPDKFQYMIHFILFSLFIYTPKIKKITFLKNIYCATIVSFSSCFSAMLYASSMIHIGAKNTSLLKLFSQTIFLGSLFKEILMDIRDYEGDYYNNIKTLPVVYGKSNALLVASGALKINFILNLVMMTELFGLKYSWFVPLLFFPMMYNVKDIRKNNYDTNMVIETSNLSTKCSIFVLIYYCMIAKNIAH